jgi:glutamyl-Q tRNA(Asp) synthetase
MGIKIPQAARQNVPMASLDTAYVGRFAPSPTGPLHAGSLVAALASWLDARAHGGQWLIRIEDVDTPRCMTDVEGLIIEQLRACGLESDQPPLRQSERGAVYEAALQHLIGKDQAYACGCTRREIDLALEALGKSRARNAEQVYPGTCRSGLNGKPARATRLRTHAPDGGDVHIAWTDRRLGDQAQNLTREVGDFVLHRADGLWAYQLAVVIDDAAQGVTDVVRGEDLADNTARQIHLQRQLGLATPRYLHAPLVLAANGEKLSKQNGARPLDLDDPLRALRAAGRVLGVEAHGSTVDEWLRRAMRQWADGMIEASTSSRK